MINNHINTTARNFTSNILDVLETIKNKNSYEWYMFDDGLSIAETWLDYTYTYQYNPFTPLPTQDTLRKVHKRAKEFYQVLSQLRPITEKQAAYFEIMLESLDPGLDNTLTDTIIFLRPRKNWTRKSFVIHTPRQN